MPIEREIEDLIFTEAEVVDLWPETPDPRQHDRRSLYLFRKRNVRYPLFDAFDAPDTQSACPQRNVSTHALQPLVLLNSDFATMQAKRLAGRISREASGSTESRIDGPIKSSSAVSRPIGRRRQAKVFLLVADRMAACESKRNAGPAVGLEGRRRNPPRRRRGLTSRWRCSIVTNSSTCLESEATTWPPTVAPVPPQRRWIAANSCAPPGPGLACSGWRRYWNVTAARRNRRTRSPPNRRISHRRRSVAFSCSWSAGRATSICSTRSRASTELDGKPLPESFGKIHSQFLEGDPLCLASRRKWGQYGESGMPMSDLIPHMHQHADKLAVIRSCWADSDRPRPRALPDELWTGVHGLAQHGKLADVRTRLREREPARPTS